MLPYNIFTTLLFNNNNNFQRETFFCKIQILVEKLKEQI